MIVAVKTVSTDLGFGVGVDVTDVKLKTVEDPAPVAEQRHTGQCCETWELDRARRVRWVPARERRWKLFGGSPETFKPVLDLTHQVPKLPRICLRGNLPQATKLNKSERQQAIEPETRNPLSMPRLDCPSVSAETWKHTNTARQQPRGPRYEASASRRGSTGVWGLRVSGLGFRIYGPGCGGYRVQTFRV